MHKDKQRNMIKLIFKDTQETKPSKWNGYDMENEKLCYTLLLYLIYICKKRTNISIY